jgi:hypothetical protein
MISEREQADMNRPRVGPPSDPKTGTFSSPASIFSNPESLLRMCHVCTGRMVETNGFVPFWIEQRDMGTRLIPLECTCCGAVAVARVKEAA